MLNKTKRSGKKKKNNEKKRKIMKKKRKTMKKMKKNIYKKIKQKRTESSSDHLFSTLLGLIIFTRA